MIDKRRENIPFYPYVLLLFAVAFIVIACGYYINFPSETKIFYSILASGLLFGVIAFATRPVIFKELFFNKKTALWINDIIFILIIIGIGVLISHIAFRRNYRYDFTYNKMYSLSDLTIKTLKGIDKKVKINAFFIKNSSEEKIMLDLFKEYERYTDKIDFKMIDPNRDPISAQRMNIQVVGTVVVECEANKHRLLPNDLFMFPDNLSLVQKKASPKFMGEQAITSSIVNVLSNNKNVVSFITGHEEGSISGFKGNDVAGLNQLLVSEYIEVVQNSLLADEIDQRAKLVIIVSPKKDYNDDEINKLKRYVESKKGNIIFALDPNKNLPKLYDFIFKEYAVSPNYDIVVDPRGISSKYWTVAPELQPHEINNPLRDKKLLAIFFHCCSLTKETRAEVTHTTLLKTIDYTWAKRGLDSGKEIEIGFQNNIDVKGPFELGIIAKKTNTASGSTAIIFGDSDFMTNALVGTSGNRDLILNSINWLVGNNKMISITPRSLELPTIQFKPSDSGAVFTFCVLFIPSVVIFWGIIVFFYRRRVK